MLEFKGAVVQDFRLLVFSLRKPTWASDSYPNLFSNSVFTLPKYLNLKFDWPLLKGDKSLSPAMYFNMMVSQNLLLSMWRKVINGKLRKVTALLF
jgi:hypothetical protein